MKKMLFLIVLLMSLFLCSCNLGNMFPKPTPTPEITETKPEEQPNEPTEVTKYVVTFNTNGGSTIESIEVEENNTITIPVNPIKSGYRFDGWYKDQACTKGWLFSNEVVTEDLTLYAKWTKIEEGQGDHTVTFDTQGGSIITSQIVPHGYKVTKPTDPTKKGYIFDGWYYNNEVWSFIGFSITEDITLIAKWKECYHYNITVQALEQNHKYICSCGYERVEEHKFGIWKINSELSDIHYIVEERYCTICDFKQSNSYQDDTEYTKTIVFYHTMGGSWREVLNEVISEFKEIYPDWEIKCSQIGSYDDVYDQIMSDLKKNIQPDLAYCYPQHILDYLDSGKVVDLQYFVNDVTNDSNYEFNQDMINQGKVTNYADYMNLEYDKNAILSMPFFKSTEALFYNKTFFEENNLNVPTTWEEMWEICAKIKEIDPNSTPLGYDSEINLFDTLCYYYDIEYKTLTAPYYQVNNEKVKNLLLELKEYYNKGYFTTGESCGVGYTNTLMTDVTQKSRAYMCIGSTAGAKYQVNNDGLFETGVAVIPGINGKSNYYLSVGPSLVMFDNESATKNQMTMEFMKLLLNDINQAKFSLASGYMPVNEKAYDMDQIQDFIKKENIISKVYKTIYSINKKINVSTYVPKYDNFTTEIQGLVLVTLIEDSNMNELLSGFNDRVNNRELEQIIYTYEEYLKAPKGTKVCIEGIVTGMNSKSKGDQDNSLYFNSLDNKGGFYAYKLPSDPVTDGIKEGMTVKVSGKKDLYSGTYEIVDPTVTVIDQTIKTVTPVDLTEAYKAAEDLKAAELVGPQALLVTIKGVTITTAEESNGYYKFTLAGKESYIRVSYLNCPLDVEDTITFKDEFAKHAGWIANATGIISVYGGAFYLIPVSVDAFEYVSLPN